jgi:hypothetical protein
MYLICNDRMIGIDDISERLKRQKSLGVQAVSLSGRGNLICDGKSQGFAPKVTSS